MGGGGRQWRRDGRVGFAGDLFWVHLIRAPRRRRRSLRLSEIINATLDKLIFISDILANYEMQLFSRLAAGFNVAPRRCRFVAVVVGGGDDNDGACNVRATLCTHTHTHALSCSVCPVCKVP